MTVHVSVHGFFIVHAYSKRCSNKKKVIHGKLGDWVMGIEGEHPSLGPLGLFGPLGPMGPTGPFRLLKTVETMEGVRSS